LGTPEFENHLLVSKSVEDPPQPKIPYLFALPIIMMGHALQFGELRLGKRAGCRGRNARNGEDDESKKRA
jgi:hypothetical protein